MSPCRRRMRGVVEETVRYRSRERTTTSPLPYHPPHTRPSTTRSHTRPHRRTDTYIHVHRHTLTHTHTHTRIRTLLRVHLFRWRGHGTVGGRWTGVGREGGHRRPTSRGSVTPRHRLRSIRAATVGDASAPICAPYARGADPARSILVLGIDASVIIRSSTSSRICRPAPGAMRRGGTSVVARIVVTTEVARETSLDGVGTGCIIRPVSTR